ncbi:stromelysin-3-like [Ptychodera flava]|uniref:stromelysin-3-like n=1 Tax=Ptychodera flava TaxID=63121 RepID=UPI003969CEB8
MATFELLAIFITAIIFCTWDAHRVLAAPVADHPPPAPMRPIESLGDAMQFLDHYGYADVQPNALMTELKLREGIRKFQRFARLNETGELDEPTIEKMNASRCGMPDFETEADDSGRKKRYYAPTKWLKTDLTYSISQYTTDLPEWIVDREIAAAFKLWSDETPLRFTKVDKSVKADINISFPAPYIPHYDGPFFTSSFDGPGKVLAHAFYPSSYGDIAGDAHFDDGESWTYESYSGVNLYIVAAHEFGHSLGLGHSEVFGALMYPYHTGYKPDFQLHADDIAGIQYLYGSKPEEPETTVAPRPDPTPKPNPNPNPNPNPAFCPRSLDAITETKDGNTYAFKGEIYWRLTDGHVDAGYPKLIKDYWSGLKGNFDAVVTASNYWFWRMSGMQGKTWFLKGSLVWRFENNIMDPGYPKRITDEFHGLPDNIEGAFEFDGNGQTYFFKDGYFYMINWRMDVVGPFYIDHWMGIPNKIDAVLQASDRYVYFFKGGQYYKFEHDTFRTLPGYPRTIGDGFVQCNSALVSDGDSHQERPGIVVGDGGMVELEEDGGNLMPGDENSGFSLVPSVFLVVITLLVQF